MKVLHPIYAKQLFSWHAFEQSFHPDGFKELVEKFLEACNSLPLSIKVIASQLKGELDKEIWKSLLHKIRTVVPNDIKEILKISYDSLDHQEKEMFLDVACFFIGEESSSVIEFWNGLRWSGQLGLTILFNKCLVELDEDIIKMHDHLRDLGRSITANQSPYRFGFPQTIINIQNQVEVVTSGGSPFWALAASICPCLMSPRTADFHNKIQTRIGIHGIIVTADRVVQRHSYSLGGEKRYPEMIRVTGEVDDFRVWCSEQELKVDTNCGIQSLSPSLVGLKYLVISGHIFSEVSRELVWLRYLVYVFLTSLSASLGCLSSLTNLEIKDCLELECLPDSLGCFSSLTNLEITGCKKLECLPDSLGCLSSLTTLNIEYCEKLKCLPDSLGCLSSCSPHLETLHVLENHHLEEIEALPRTLKEIRLKNCEMLKKIASFARLTSLGEFCLEGWNRNEKIEGMENCIGVEVLRVESRMEVPGIESLEHLRNLRELKLIANKGAVIEHCIQRMQEWPSETTIICARAVPDAASLVESLLSRNLHIVDSFSNQKIKSTPKLMKRRSSHGDVLMLCFVINCVSSQATFSISHGSIGKRAYTSISVEKGRWAWVGVFTQCSDAVYCIYPVEGECGNDDELEKGLAVMGEGGTLMEEFRTLLPLLFQNQ